VKSTTLPHIVTYVVSGLTFIASLNPAVTALLGPAAPYAAAGIAFAGAVLSFLHNVGAVGKDPPAPPAAPTAGASK